MTQAQDFSNEFERILQLGPYVVAAFFKNRDLMLKAILELPHLSIEDSRLFGRDGTGTVIQEGVQAEDGSVGYYLITGGDISLDEQDEVVTVLNHYGQVRFTTSPQG